MLLPWSHTRSPLAVRLGREFVWLVALEFDFVFLPINFTSHGKPSVRKNKRKYPSVRSATVSIPFTQVPKTELAALCYIQANALPATAINCFLNHLTRPLCHSRARLGNVALFKMFDRWNRPSDLIVVFMNCLRAESFVYSPISLFGLTSG